MKSRQNRIRKKSKERKSVNKLSRKHSNKRSRKRSIKRSIKRSRKRVSKKRTSFRKNVKLDGINAVSNNEVSTFEIIELIGCPACTKVKNTLKDRYKIVTDSEEYYNAIKNKKFNIDWNSCASKDTNDNTKEYHCFPKVFTRYKNKLYFIGGNPEVEQFLKIDPTDDSLINNFLNN